MITDKDKDIILKCAKKYNVASVILFGSALEPGEKYNDIDIGVNGIEPRLFFKFYAELFKYMTKPVDLVDLSKKSSFNEYIEKNGVKIYG